MHRKYPVDPDIELVEFDCSQIVRNLDILVQFHKDKEILFASNKNVVVYVN